jgi:hypothetical protein
MRELETQTMKITGTIGESTINNNHRKLADFCVFDNMRIMNKHKHLSKKAFTNLHGVLVGQNQ